MKKFTLVAAMAMVAAAASAQYTCDPVVKTVLDQGKVTYVGTVILNESAIEQFKAQGAEIVEYGPDDVTRHLYIWPDGSSFTAGDSSNPGVGDHFDGYTSLNVGSIGWSGAGFAIDATPGVNTSMWNDETHFHLAYMSNGPAPAAVGIVVADGEDWGSSPAKFSMGDSFENTPVIAPKSADDWQGIDVTFGQLKKLFPSFSYKAVESWHGNIMSVLAGAVTGTNISLDAVYFYNIGDNSGVANIETEASWVVTDNTINVNGANGIELYNLAGQQVKKTAGSVLGISNLPAGIYVAKAGKAVRKVVVK